MHPQDFDRELKGPANSIGTERPVLLQSRLLAHVPHAFTTRQGGRSAPPFDSLNFGNPSDLPDHRRDPRANIYANFELVKRELGCPEREIVQVHQVHADGVHVVTSASPHPPGPDPRADGIVTSDARVLAAVRVADCAPILLATRCGSIVSAVHAGWRGVVTGVLSRALERLRSLAGSSTRSGDGAGNGTGRETDVGIVAAVGPCIGVGHFEVGPEVVLQFERCFPERDHDRIIRDRTRDGKARLDLRVAIESQLRREGVREVDSPDWCTAADAQNFFSHRRDGGLTGRMIGIIGPSARPG